MGGFSDFLLAGSSQNEQRKYTTQIQQKGRTTLGSPTSDFQIDFFYGFFMLGCQILEAATTVMMTFGAQRFELQHDEESATGVAPRCFRKARDNPAPFSVEPYDFY